MIKEDLPVRPGESPSPWGARLFSVSHQHEGLDTPTSLALTSIRSSPPPFSIWPGVVVFLCVPLLVYIYTSLYLSLSLFTFAGLSLYMFRYFSLSVCPSLTLSLSFCVSFSLSIFAYVLPESSFSFQLYKISRYIFFKPSAHADNKTTLKLHVDEKRLSSNKNIYWEQSATVRGENGMRFLKKKGRGKARVCPFTCTVKRSCKS